jgi:hypothetical protein
MRFAAASLRQCSQDAADRSRRSVRRARYASPEVFASVITWCRLFSRIAVSLTALLWLAGAVGPNELIHVAVDRSGCAISHPNEVLYLFLWRVDQRPGDGSTWPPRRTVTGRETLFQSEPGYYRIELTSKHCWERFYPVAVLPRHSRHILLQPWNWVRREHTLYDLFYAPYGAVAGELKKGESAPSLRESSQVTAEKRPQQIYSASLEPDGFYYFDEVGPGSYTISIPSPNGVVKKTVKVNANKLTVLPAF